MFFILIFGFFGALVQSLSQSSGDSLDDPDDIESNKLIPTCGQSLSSREWSDDGFSDNSNDVFSPGS